MKDRIDRNDPADAAEFVQTLYPDPEIRRSLLGVLADSIDEVTRLGAISWNLSIRRERQGFLQVNTGSYAVIQLFRAEITVGVTGALVPEDLTARFTPALYDGSDFKSLPDGRFVAISLDDLPDLPAILARIWPAHVDLIERAAATIRKPASWLNHYGGVTAYMREFLERDVDDPPPYLSGGSGGSPETREARREEFLALYEEFVTAYALTPTGERHFAAYAESREQAARKFDELVAAADRGEDVTDRTLQYLLPHAGTANNREQGSWISITPAITKDAKQLFEGAKWVEPANWPKVAALLLDFVRRCVDDPSQLEAACAEFAASPYAKGLQSGMVSPILNALRPHAFLVVNNKSRAVFNYFLDRKLRASIADYPAANEAGWELVRGVELDLHLPGLPDEVSDADLVDVFCHWLVAVRKFSFGRKSGETVVDDVQAWIFQSNPRYFDLDGALAELDELVWKVTRYASDVDPGEAVYLWEAGRDAGICAVATVVAEPAFVPQLSTMARFVREGLESGDVLRARLRIDRVLPRRVTRAEMLARPELEKLSILVSAQGTNFPVTPEQQLVLERLIAEAGETSRVWKIAPGEGEWPKWREEGIVAIGWEEIGDVSSLSRDAFDARLDELAERSPGDYKRAGASQVWTFSRIKQGDRIVANRGTSRVVGIGTVTGPYEFVPSAPFGHRLPVAWEDTTERHYDGGPKWRRTLVALDPGELGAIIAAGAADAAADVDEVEEILEPNPAYSLGEMAEETGFDEATLARWVRAIERKGQAILYGPPGTGKTYVAQRLARHLVAGGYGVVDTVQFHPAYAYEDFIQGIRPVAREGGGLDYPLVPGRFLDFCERAREREGTSVLVVDEINRANLSRVFGELMYLLEYRDESIDLAGGRRFAIPSSVRIVGTMNTADRSIALVDHALRRRFAFLALEPQYDVLRRRLAGSRVSAKGLVEVLEELNDAIGDPHYAVGIAFFLKEGVDGEIEDVWRMEIEPYIEEYFFDRRERFERFRWERVAPRVMGE